MNHNLTQKSRSPKPPCHRMALMALVAASVSLTSCALPKRVWRLLTVRRATPVAPQTPITTPAATAPPEVAEARKAITAKSGLYDWWGDDMSGRPTVRIDLSEQKATILRGGKKAGWTYVATGVAKHPTPTGSFSIIEKKATKRSNRYGVIVDADGDIVNGDATAGKSRIPKGGRFVGAPMNNWMRLTNSGIGMHKGNIPSPGSPASHGCIRLPGEMARILYSVAPYGTPVTITR